MTRSQLRGGVTALMFSLAAVVAASRAGADDAPPPDSGGQPPLDRGHGAVMPEKSLMPKAEKEDDSDLDGPFALEYLKRLAGDWESDDGEILASYRIIGGGGSVLETLRPEADDAVVSVYYMEEDDLVSTVYAAEGNQPRLKFDPKRSFFGRYWFVLSGGTGFDKTRDRHVHEKSLQFPGSDQLDVELTLYDGKTRAEASVLKLHRKALP